MSELLIYLIQFSHSFTNLLNKEFYALISDRKFSTQISNNKSIETQKVMVPLNSFESLEKG